MMKCFWDKIGSTPGCPNVEICGKAGYCIADKQLAEVRALKQENAELKTLVEKYSDLLDKALEKERDEFKAQLKEKEDE